MRMKHKPRRRLRQAVIKSALLVAAPALFTAAFNLSANAQQSVPNDANAAPQQDKSVVSKKRATSPNATVNLVNILVQKGVLTEDQAQVVIKEAEDEAYVAREAAKTAKTKADEADKTANAAAAAASPPGTKRVTYVPEFVKKQLRDDIRREVMAQAQDEGWASPGKYPEWASRIRLSGDFRTRYQGNFFPVGNDTSGDLVNFNAINTGSPFDTGALIFPPTLNADQDRHRFLLRARLAVDADLYDGFSLGMRFATGQDGSPVSTNQTLGGSGGNFSKYALWLDRAYLKYQPYENIALNIGRFDNPFYAPTDLVWYRELEFDGLALQTKYDVLPGFQPFAVAGAFPIFNTDFNFSSNASTSVSQGAKYASTDKYLFAGQGGFRWKPVEDVNVGFGAGYYDFSNVQGRLSDPCLVLTTADACDTDDLRPSFAQKGNTYMALRNIVPVFSSTGVLGPQYQYFGLASAFREVILTGKVDFAQFNPIHVMLDGEFVKNVAFNRSALNASAINGGLWNNLGPVADGSYTGPFAGGDTGYMGRITVGHPELKKLWDWNAFLAYKYLESDATMDAFTDPDFGLGGTNLKGYIVGGNLAFNSNLWMTLRFMSANSIAGAPYAVDTLQVDLNAKF